MSQCASSVYKEDQVNVIVSDTYKNMQDMGCDVLSSSRAMSGEGHRKIAVAQACQACSDVAQHSMPT